MQITASTLALTVEDVTTSAAFLRRHFGYAEEMSADGFVSLKHDGGGVDVVYLRRGIEVLPESYRHDTAAGVILVFVVDDLAGEEKRLRGEGVEITMPLREEPWGEKLFQVTDPNGVVIELVEWAKQ
ncbi:VOC family protein [Kitasatospora aureofaciens]|uniref:VOC family protein n=1 Tax=Kitasatospora aureofaciens TaxID=1894 RepID=UPI001C472F26|nr:VOC family protein [Kitasatospora aureofaciens]MBV6698624.1 VOC family protein [Kitasatospora aureofaciens]